MANAKRVLLLATQADWGGVQTFLIRFGIYLKNQDVEVMIAAGGKGRLWEEAKKAGIQARELRHMKREISPLHDLAAIWELRCLIKEFKPDAVHLNSTKMGVLGSIACLLFTRRPHTVYYIGGWVFLEQLPAWRKWLYQYAETFTAKFKDVIVTVHPGDQKLAEILGIKPRHNIITIPNGLPNDFTDKLLSRDAARDTLKLPQNAYIFGTVANVYPPKALPTYVKNLDSILDGLKDVHAVIIGGGPGLKGLRDIVNNLKNRERIHLAGERPDADRLYKAFDAFVLPSEKEGMPWALLEAMTAGLPCIATDVGANRWMLHENGAIIPPRDAKALRDAMNDLMLFKDERRHMGERAAFDAKRRFSWTRSASDMRDALSI